MTIPYIGRCACGAISYECNEKPLAVYNCHCQACQQSCGAPFSTIWLFAAESMRISGVPSHYTAALTDKSDHVRTSFCGTCGTPLFARSSVKPDIAIVRATTLADGSWIRPVADIWTISARPEIGMDTHIPKVYRAPRLLEADDSVRL